LEVHARHPERNGLPASEAKENVRPDNSIRAKRDSRADSPRMLEKMVFINAKWGEYPIEKRAYLLVTK
jgi:hypothetical protein